MWSILPIITYLFALDWHFSNQQMVVVKADRSSESVSMSSLFNEGEVKRCDRQRLFFILLFSLPYFALNYQQPIDTVHMQFGDCKKRLLKSWLFLLIFDLSLNAQCGKQGWTLTFGQCAIKVVKQFEIINWIGCLTSAQLSWLPIRWVVVEWVDMMNLQSS